MRNGLQIASEEIGKSHRPPGRTGGTAIAKNGGTMNTNNSPAWISPLARTGYSAKGVVYLTIGVMAFLAAIGKGGGLIGSSGALDELASKPFGSALLIVLGIGLLAYSGYRILCAFIDCENEGEDGSGLAKRAGYLGSGLVYGALGVTALTGLGGGSGGGEGEMTSKALEIPGGVFLVGAVAVGIIVAGIFQWVKALKGTYRHKFTLDSLAASKRNLVEKAAKFGLISRGIVFPVIGVFLLMAAVQSDPSEAKGIRRGLGGNCQSELRCDTSGYHRGRSRVLFFLLRDTGDLRKFRALTLTWPEIRTDRLPTIRCRRSRSRPIPLGNHRGSGKAGRGCLPCSFSDSASGR